MCIRDSSRGRCLTVRLLANATRPPEYRISAPDGERPRATNILSTFFRQPPSVVVSLSLDTGKVSKPSGTRHSLSSALGEKGSLRPHEKEFFFVRTRQDAELRRLQSGVRCLLYTSPSPRDR